MKKFISGLIVGVLITISITVFAAEELNVNINPFPINVNGQQQNIEAYNINGSTYIKLSDIPKATQNVLEVEFDQENKKININTLKNTQINDNAIQNPGNTEGEENMSEGTKKTSDGLPIIYIDEKPYVSVGDFSKKYYSGKQTNFYVINNKWDETGRTNNISLYFLEEKWSSKGKKILLENIPALSEEKRLIIEYTDDECTNDIGQYSPPLPRYIPLDYYTDKILSAIEENEKNRVN